MRILLLVKITFKYFLFGPLLILQAKIEGVNFSFFGRNWGLNFSFLKGNLSKIPLQKH